MRVRDNAVSEALGALLLLALTVIGISIVLVAALSQVHIVKFPTTELAAVDLYNGVYHTLEIVHTGGDILYHDDLEIRVNGSNVTSSGLLDGVGFISPSQNLSIGKKLLYGPLDSVENLSILYNASGSGSSLMYYTEKFVKVNI
jgi:hypothetical protein